MKAFALLWMMLTEVLFFNPESFSLNSVIHRDISSPRLLQLARVNISL